MSVILYKRQRQIYDFISQYLQKNGFAPTLKEIANAIGVTSLATIHEHLQALQKKGVIKKHEGTIRGIELNNQEKIQFSDSITLPIIGVFDGLTKIETDTNGNQNFKVSSEIITGKKRAFVLQIKGDNLKNIHVLDNDYLIIEETKEIKNGEAILAKLDNDNIVIKLFNKEFNRIRLDDLDGNNNSIYTLNLNIQGKIVGIIRKFT